MISCCLIIIINSFLAFFVALLPPYEIDANRCSSAINTRQRIIPSNWKEQKYHLPVWFLGTCNLGKIIITNKAILERYVCQRGEPSFRYKQQKKQLKRFFIFSSLWLFFKCLSTTYEYYISP